MTPTKTHLAFAKNALISLGFYTFLLGGGGSSVYALDYTDYSLPSNITLNGGQRQDTITSIKSPQGWQMTTIGLNRNPHLSINGTAISQYTLQVRDDTTTFYSGGFSIGSGVEATLTSIHTLAIESGSVSVGSGASFRVISSGNTINPQGSEYGGESKVRFARGTSLSLAQNARAEFSNANFFIHDGSTAISQGANLTISATKAIRFQNEFINNGGRATLNGNVYNVGGSVGIQNTISNFTLNGGSVSVVGNFYNGLESKDMSVDSTGSVAGGFNTFDAQFGGGGNLTINGGSMSVSGILISKLGGSSIRDGGIYDSKPSTISIYGGTLSATGGVQNKAGSTLTIGALGGKMGQIVGSVTNSGQIIIDAQGANEGTHKLITGNLNSGSNISLRNGNTEFATSNLQNTELTVKLDNVKISSFTSSLESNQKSTLNALGNQIYTTNGATSPRLTQSADLLNQSAFTLLSAPFSLISIMKSNLSYPISYTSRTSKIKTNSLEIGFIGGILQSSSKISGGSGGIRIGYARDFASYFGSSSLEIEAGYVYSAIKDSATSTLLSYGSSLTSHTAGAEAIFSIPLTRDARLGLKFGLGGFMTFIDSHREVDTRLLWANPSLKSSLSLYQVALDSSVSYEVVRLSNFIATPYLGLHQSVNILPSFAESSGQSNAPQSTSIALKTQGYKAYHLGLIVGLEARLRLKERAFGVERDLKNAESKKGVLLGKIEYEYLALSSQKSIVFEYPSTDSISLKPPHSHKVRGALGFQKDFTNGVTLGVEASIQSLISTQSISKTLGQSLYFYGANATVGYRF